MFRPDRRWWFVVPLVLVCGLLAWWLWPSGAAAPRARQYRDVDVCLLTDRQGLSGVSVGSVWAGMQDASARTGVRVSYLAVQGDDTVGNALPYLTSLLQRGCAVVLAVGPAEVGAVVADASRYPRTRFVVVGGSAAGANVTEVPATAAVRDGVMRAIVTVVGR